MSNGLGTGLPGVSISGGGGMGYSPFSRAATPNRPGPASHANPPPVSEPVRAAGGNIPKGGMAAGMRPTTIIRPPVATMGGAVPGLMPEGVKDAFDAGPLERPY